MTTAMTPTPDRSVALKPLGSDVVNIAAVNAMAQVLLDRGEWASKKLIDVKSAKSVNSDADYNNASFATINDGALSFTDVSIGDVLVLHASTVWDISTQTAPLVEQRWLVGGAVDATVGGDGAYPRIQVATGASTDFRALSCTAVHVATAAGSLAAALQARFNNAATVICTHSQIVGVHFRLGAT